MPRRGSCMDLCENTWFMKPHVSPDQVVPVLTRGRIFLCHIRILPLHPLIVDFHYQSRKEPNAGLPVREDTDH